MYKEYLAVYESSPVVDAFKLESHLYGISIKVIQMILKVLAVLVQSFQEEITGVISVRGLTGVAHHHLTAESAAESSIEINRLTEHIVGVEPTVEPCVYFIELIQMV